MLKSLSKNLKQYKQYTKNKLHYNQFEDYINMGTFLPGLHLIKQNNIHAYRDQFGTEILVETGTYLGDMVEAQKSEFKFVYSIELSVALHKKAVERFINDKHIKIIQGDSAIVLKGLLPELNKPALFWLDGHYSGDITAQGDKDTPILSELEQILKHNAAHVILIDDARLFTGKNDYPTIPALCQFIISIDPNKEIIIADDIIRITPKK